MLTIEDLSFAFANRVLYENVNLQLQVGERYGLTGANGAGKTTFLKVLMGELSPSSGKIRGIKIEDVGIMKQDHFKYDHLSLLQTVMTGKPKLLKALDELERLSTLEHPTDEEMQALGDCDDYLGRYGGYRAEADAASLLSGLGLPEEKHKQTMSTLSGGYRLRVLLAQVLFSEPEVLFLDEPTNHLDIPTVAWLESYLKKFQGLMVLISHDRDFINAISTHILDVDYGTIRRYRGNYDAFLKQREEDEVYHASVLKNQEQKKEQLQQFVDRFKAKATKARQAGSRKKMLERMEADMQQHVAGKSTRRKPNLRFNMERRSGETPLKVDQLCKKYGDHQVLKDVCFEIDRGQRVAIIGANGIGKSTLLNIVCEYLEADNGKYEWGYQAKISFFPQNLDQEVHGQISAYAWLERYAAGYIEKDIRSVLGRVFFGKEESEKKCDVLSGGEKARLLFARLMVEQSNVLVLDEPSNHLDLETIESLVEALKNYEGTLLFVSHNRWFVSELAERIIEIKENGLEDIQGGYEDYLAKSGIDHLQKKMRSKSKPRLSPEDVQGLRLEEKAKKTEFSKVEKKITSLEKKLAHCHQKMSGEGFYEQPQEKQQKVLDEQKELDAELSEAYVIWERCGDALEDLRKKLGDC